MKGVPVKTLPDKKGQLIAPVGQVPSIELSKDVRRSGYYLGQIVPLRVWLKSTLERHFQGDVYGRFVLSMQNLRGVVHISTGC